MKEAERKKPEHGGGISAGIRMDFSANLNPLGMPACVRGAVAAVSDGWERYPDPDGRSYCEALAAHLSPLCTGGEDGAADPPGDLPARIVPGNGAADLIYRIVQALHPRRALLPVPAFSEYEKALREGGCGQIDFLALTPEQNFDLPEDFAARIDGNVDIVYLCQPANPSGRLIDPALLRQIVRRCAACGTTLIVDECFLPFVPEAASRSALRFMGSGADLVVLSAMTKFFSIPGLRLGFCVCARRETAEKIRGAGQYWSVSAPALAAGEAILSDPDLEQYAARTRRLVAEERPFLTEGLQAAGITVIPSAANFVLCHSDPPLYGWLLREGILIRDCANFRGLSEGWQRIAVRTHEENAALLRTLAEQRRTEASWHIRS